MRTRSVRIWSVFVTATVTLGVPQLAAASIQQSAVVSENPVDFTPNVVATTAVGHPIVNAISQTGSRMWAGGHFERVENSGRTQQYTRNNLVVFDANTGAVSSIAPSFDGAVWAVKTAGSSVYVGGDFRTVNGVTRPALVKLNATTGAVDTAFKAPFTGGRIDQIKWRSGRLIVGGSAGKKLLALDPATGADTGYLNLAITDPIPNAWGTVSVYDFAIDPAGTRLVATGNFQKVNGQVRTRAFMVDLGTTTGSLAPWYYSSFTKPCSTDAPRRIAYLQGVDFSPDGSYFVITATGQIPKYRSEIGEMICDGAGRFETSVVHPTRPTWINYTGGDSVWAVSITGAAVYVQGHFQWLDNPMGHASLPGPGAVRRTGVGAINPSTGKALSWAPGKPAQQGGKDLYATSTGLWVVSDSLQFHGEYHRGIAFCPLP